MKQVILHAVVTLFVAHAAATRVFALDLPLAPAVGQQSATTPPAGTVPITIVSTQVDAADQSITFTLENTSDKTITAWDVRIDVGTEPEVRTGGYGVDAFRAFSGLAQGRRRYITPGATLTVTTRVPSGPGNIHPVLISPRAAVFADGSAAGIPKYIDFFFDQRREQLNAWKDIVQRLKDAKARGRIDERALQDVLAQVMGTTPQSGAADLARTAFSSNFKIALRDVHAGRVQASSTLDRFLSEAEQNVTITAAHVRR